MYTIHHRCCHPASESNLSLTCASTDKMTLSLQFTQGLSQLSKEVTKKHASLWVASVLEEASAGCLTRKAWNVSRVRVKPSQWWPRKLIHQRHQSIRSCCSTMMQEWPSWEDGGRHGDPGHHDAGMTQLRGWRQT